MMKSALFAILFVTFALFGHAQTIEPAAAEELAQEQAFQNDKGSTLKLDVSSLQDHKIKQVVDDLSNNPPVVKELRHDEDAQILEFTHNLYLLREEVLAVLEKHDVPETAIISYEKNK